MLRLTCGSVYNPAVAECLLALGVSRFTYYLFRPRGRCLAKSSMAKRRSRSGLTPILLIIRTCVIRV